MTPISRVLGVEVWFNCIAIMTHGAAVPPEGPSGGPLPYSAYLQQRQQSLALAIRYVSHSRLSSSQESAACTNSFA